MLGSLSETRVQARSSGRLASRARSSVDRVHASGAWGRWFESSRAHETKTKNVVFSLAGRLNRLLLGADLGDGGLQDDAGALVGNDGLAASNASKLIVNEVKTQPAAIDGNLGGNLAPMRAYLNGGFKMGAG